MERNKELSNTEDLDKFIKYLDGARLESICEKYLELASLKAHVKMNEYVIEQLKALWVEYHQDKYLSSYQPDDDSGQQRPPIRRPIHVQQKPDPDDE